MFCYRMIVPLVAACLLFSSSAEAQQDGLWKKAVALAGANDKWMPGLMSEQEKVLVSEDNTEETFEYHIRVTPENSGIKVKIIKALQNGKDIMNEMEQDQFDDQMLQSEQDNPFHPDNQRGIKFKRNGETRTIQGKTCIGFEYQQISMDNVWIGTAWLEKDTGIPREISYRASQYPIYAGEVTVLDMSAIIRYATPESGVWYMETSEVDSSIEVNLASLMAFKGRSRTVTRFSDYWQKQ